MTKEQELQARIAELEKEITTQRDNRLAEFKNSLANKLSPEFKKSGVGDYWLMDTDSYFEDPVELASRYEHILYRVFDTLQMEGVDCARNGQ